MIGSQHVVADVKSTACVLLFPTYAAMEPDESAWKIPVFGGVYETREVNLRKKLLLRLLQRVMRVDAQAFEHELFRQRIEPFVANGERGCRIGLEIGQRTFALRKRTKRNGLFRGQVRLPGHSFQEHVSNGEHWVQMTARDERGGPIAQTDVRLIRGQGLSIVSDIDDTIKETGVGSRQELLANTFLREFRTIDGMASAYQAWEEQGAVFHYVSSSPWQLFRPLAELRRAGGFPAGSMHLRAFRLRDHMLRRLLLIHRRGKRVEIQRLLESFPQRRFVLVGDSGEKDPEIYGSLARRFGRQVDRILIRDLPARPLDKTRKARAFRRLPRAQWMTFTDPSSLPRRM